MTPMASSVPHTYLGEPLLSLAGMTPNLSCFYTWGAMTQTMNGQQTSVPYLSPMGIFCGNFSPFGQHEENPHISSSLGSTDSHPPTCVPMGQKVAVSPISLTSASQTTLGASLLPLRLSSS